MLGRWASRALPCYGLSALVLAAVLYPLSFDRRRDSFPLSSYPMFARHHEEPTLRLSFLIAYGDGYRRSIPPRLVASAEVLQAQASIRGAVRRGPRAMKALCEQIADRIGREPSFDRATEVRLIRGRYDAVAHLTGADTAGRERVRVRCRVPR